ncbi:MAG TPA: 16S rRNA (guanine(527)-N(7))-methyltransferase RsmG [bacterium]
MAFLDVLKICLAEAQIDADEDALEKFRAYSEELKVWNQRTDLTTIESEEDIAIKHFIDSLLVARFIPENAFLLDIGSGAGFPGIPIKIIKPSVRLLLLDSSEKKVIFLKHIIRLLRLGNASSLQQRAEDAAFTKIMAGTLDVVISRAFARVAEYIEIAEPYAKPEGSIICMLGKEWRSAVMEAEGIIKEKGLKMGQAREFVLPRGKGIRGIAVIKKE